MKQFFFSLFSDCFCVWCEVGGLSVPTSFAGKFVFPPVIFSVTPITHQVPTDVYSFCCCLSWCWLHSGLTLRASGFILGAYRASSPPVFCFSNILTILGPLYFSTSFSISLSPVTKNVSWDLDLVHIGRTDIFEILNLWIHEPSLHFHFFRSCLESVNKVLWVSPPKCSGSHFLILGPSNFSLSKLSPSEPWPGVWPSPTKRPIQTWYHPWEARSPLWDCEIRQHLFSLPPSLFFPLPFPPFLPSSSWSFKKLTDLIFKNFKFYLFLAMLVFAAVWAFL